MAHYLLPSNPIYGHVAPMVTIGRGLAARGHRVDVLTGSKYRHRVRAAGLGFRALPADVDYDDAELDRWLPDRARHHGIAAGRHDIIALFLRPIPSQARAIDAALAAEAYDAVVADSAYLGVLPLLLSRPAARRLPVVGVSMTPLALHSVDCAHFGSGLPPGASSFTRMRNRQIRWLLAHGPLRPVQAALDAALEPFGIPAGRLDYFDHVAAFDLAIHLGVAGIEYPRREMPDHVRLVGPLPSSADPVAEPDWWGDLDGSRPIVHVTQGTVANVDPSQLLVPTIRALAGSEVLVLAATGGRPVREVVEALGTLPDNARVAEFLPYDTLLPRTDVLVTNGGYGTVLQAARHGVPMVVAGDSEDKPEVAARVAWSGAGVDLRTGRPSAARLRAAVQRVLADPRYRRRAGALQHEVAAGPDPIDVLTSELERLVASPLVPHAGHLRGDG